MIDIFVENTRDAPGLASFLSKINILVVNIFNFISNDLISYILSEPILMFTVGVIALTGTVGILGRMLSRD